MKLSEVKFTDFAVGYAKADITPDPNSRINLTGTGDYATRLSTGRRESLWLNCITFTDTEGETVILYGADLHGIEESVLNEVREQITEKTGVPGDHIQASASHNHHAPGTSPTEGEPIASYLKFLKATAVRVAIEALENRKEAKMFFHFLRPEGMMWPRHYFMMDGTFKGTSIYYPEEMDNFCGYSEKGDNLLQLVKFTREGEKDVMIINWQGHPFEYIRSALYPGDKYHYTYLYGGAPAVMRQRLLDKTDCESVYFCGNGGNSTQRTFIRHHNRYAHYEDYGRALGEMIVEAYDDFRPAETGKIHYEINLTRSFPEHKNRWPIHDNRHYPYGAFGFGDFGFVSGPGEMFQKNAMRVREESPYLFTIYAQLSNGGSAYIPSAEAWEYPAYEQGPSFVPRGAGEIFEKEMKEMLHRVFAKSGQTPKEKYPGYITDHSPKPDGVFYENPNPEAQPVEVNNGYCQIKLLADGQETTLLVLNKELAQRILRQKNPKLLRDERNVVADME